MKLTIATVCVFVLINLVSSQVPDDDQLVQDFSDDAKSTLNMLVHHCWSLAYTYEAMANYYASPAVGITWMNKLFHHSADNHLCQARHVVNYVAIRGSNVQFKDIKAGSEKYKTSFTNVLDAAKQALTLELSMNKMMNAYLSKETKDMQTTQFLGEFLHEGAHRAAFWRTAVTRLQLPGNNNFVGSLLLRESKHLHDCEEEHEEEHESDHTFNKNGGHHGGGHHGGGHHD